MKAISFNLISGYDSLDRPVFTGLDFNITPGYEPGELNSDNIEVMESMKRYVGLYFESTGKKVNAF